MALLPMKKLITENRFVNRYRSAIREKAISRAKAKIALAGLKSEDMELSDLESIVKEEEDEIINKVKKMPLYMIIGLLGIGVW
jgi:hypothetical protein